MEFPLLAVRNNLVLDAGRLVADNVALTGCLVTYGIQAILLIKSLI